MTRPIRPQVPNTPRQTDTQKKASESKINAQQKQTIDKTKAIELVPLSSSKASIQTHRFQKQVEKKPTRVTAKAAATLGTSPLQKPLHRLKTLRQMALPKKPLKREKKHLVALGSPEGKVSKSAAAVWQERTGKNT